MSVRRGPPIPVQASLLGTQERADTSSLFFCAFPDPTACEAIAEETNALRVEHSLIGLPTTPNRLHVTLHYLGEHLIEREDIVQAASNAAARVAHAPVGFTLARAASFSTRGEQSPCVLLCEDERPPLHGVWRELGNHLMAAGLGRYVKREFTPHVTLLYDTRVLAPQAIEPIGWEVRDFSLVRSVQGEYRVLGSWALRRA